MRYPLASWLGSILFWIIVFVSFSWWIFLANHQVEKVVNVDANLIVESKSAVKNSSVSAPLKTESATEKSSTALENQNQNAAPNFRPLPKIPDDLRNEAFQNYAIARFHIAADGSFTVELIKPCSNPKLNFLLLESLKKWQFIPEKHLGIFVATTKDVRVEFKVE
ncbi:MAG: hypothetical protein V4612_06010 [Pseudomonadota bacterium]